MDLMLIAIAVDDDNDEGSRGLSRIPKASFCLVLHLFIEFTATNFKIQ
jgi:hypothetical protein